MMVKRQARLQTLLLRLGKLRPAEPQRRLTTRIRIIPIQRTLIQRPTRRQRLFRGRRIRLLIPTQLQQRGRLRLRQRLLIHKLIASRQNQPPLTNQVKGGFVIIGIIY